MTLMTSLVAMCDPHYLCGVPNCPLGLPPAPAAGPPRPLEPGLCLQLHHDQDLGDCEQPQHHEDQQVIGGHTREVQTEEGACSAVLPKIFLREVGFRDGESGQR